MAIGRRAARGNPTGLLSTRVSASTGPSELAGDKPTGASSDIVDTLRVRDARDVEQVVRAALASEQPLEIVGHGGKRLIGQTVDVTVTTAGGPSATSPADALRAA